MVLRRRFRRSYAISTLLVVVAVLQIVAVTVQGALTPVSKATTVHTTNQPYTVVRAWEIGRRDWEWMGNDNGGGWSTRR
jgi:hypothetical protein